MIFCEFPTFRVKLARAGAHMIKFEKYEPSAFTGEKLINLNKKQRFYKKKENAHEIRKKTTGLCLGVMRNRTQILLKIYRHFNNLRCNFNDLKFPFNNLTRRLTHPYAPHCLRLRRLTSSLNVIAS